MRTGSATGWCAAALLAASLFGCVPASPPGARAGEAFPPQAFARLDRGEDLIVPGEGATALVVNVWATWCEPCRREMASLERLHALSPGGVRVIGISVDDDRRLASEFVRRQGLTFANGIDLQGSLVAPGVGVTRFPTTFVIDAGGVVRWREEAARDWSDAKTLERLRSALRLPS